MGGGWIGTMRAGAEVVEQATRGAGDCERRRGGGAQITPEVGAVSGEVA